MQIEDLRDRSCECRDINGRRPPIESPDEHATVHDCDIEIYDHCVVALEAIDEEEEYEARGHVAAAINARAKGAR